jgi:beta-mannanase
MWYTAAYADPTPVMDEIAAAVASHPGLEASLGLSLGSISSPEPPRTAAIAAGVYDAELTTLAQRIKALPTTVFVRIGYEFDLLGGQYGPAETYKLAYVHIVDLLRAKGVKNAVYVWHSAGAFWRGDSSFLGQARGEYGMPVPDADPQPIAAFYPGREYVDAFGISYWGDTCCFGRTDATARELYEARTREILDQAKALGLPIVIGESTPANVGADNGKDSVAWVNGAFDLIEAYDIRLWSLIAMNWQDSDFFSQPFWNGYWPDARIGHFAPTREAFLTRAAQPRYLFREAD